MAGSIYQLFGFRLLQSDPLANQKPAIEQSSITSAKIGVGGETGPDVQFLHSSVSAKVGDAGETVPTTNIAAIQEQ
jgi:hypothetical protein